MGVVGDHHSSHLFSSSDAGHCTTRKVSRSSCRTEEVEPGKFLKKCEKIEEVLKDCVGRPTEVLESNREYSEEDVTHQMTKGSFSLDSEASEPFNFRGLRSDIESIKFPGLHSDIESIEREFISGFDSFFKAAEEMTNGFFSMFGAPGAPHTHEGDSFAGANRRGIPVEVPKEVPSRSCNSDGDVDISGLSKDV